jgi:hypothetical protein
MIPSSAARGWVFSLVALPLLACESPTSAAEEADRLIVETVEVRVLDAPPVQVRASVQGHLRDECEMVGDTTQSRSGHTITVTIATTRDNQRERPCIQESLAVERDVPLEGPFPAGTYVVRVNGVERTFRVD